MTTSVLPAPVGPGRHRIRQVAQRLGWGVADQGISSISNFALGLFAAHQLGASDFGAFSLAFVTYTVVINAARGLSTDPLLVRFSGPADQRWREATASATGSALTIGVVAGLISVVVGLALPGPLGPVYVALGVALPGLALQDSWRFAFFAAGRGAISFVNDLVITLLLIGVLVVLHLRLGGSAAICLLVLGATATVGAVIGALQAKVLPRPLRAVTWLRTHRHLSVRYFLENVSVSGAGQVRSFVLGAVASLAAVGYVRAAEILIAPVFVLLSGLSQVAVPEATRIFRRDPAHLRRFCLVFGSAQAAVAVAWGVVLLVVFPLGPGHALIGNLWEPTQPLLPAISLTAVAVAFCNAGLAGLRAMGLARLSLRAQLTGSAAYVVCASVGAVVGGALGASWGVTLGQSLSALAWWYQLRNAFKTHEATRAEPLSPRAPTAAARVADEPGAAA